MPHSHVNLIYHVIFSTKDRKPLITDEYRERLYNYIGGIIRAQGGQALAINGVADHVHILVKLRQDKTLADLIRDLKSNASGWIHNQFPEAKKFAWQNGYGAFSVSASQIEEVSQYIANQKMHHQKRTFKDEFISFLKANRIEFDESYLWK